MVDTNFSIKGMMKRLVPITRFNRGEASKIFDEVSESGVKIVLKNNVPVGVLVAPEQYQAMVEMLEEYTLFFEAENRMKNAASEATVPHAQVMKSLQISKSELDDMDVDIE